MEYDEDSEGLIVAIRTSQGNSQSVVYDALEQVKSMTDVFGNVTSYSYDLQQASGPNNTTPSAGSVVTRIDEITLQKKYGKRKASKTLFSPLDASDSLRL